MKNIILTDILVKYIFSIGFNIILLTSLLLMLSCDKAALNFGNIPYEDDTHQLKVYWDDAEVYIAQPYQFVYKNISKDQIIYFELETDFFIIAKDGSFLGTGDNIKLGIFNNGDETIIEDFYVN